MAGIRNALYPDSIASPSYASSPADLESQGSSSTPASSALDCDSHEILSTPRIPEDRDGDGAHAPGGAVEAMRLGGVGVLRNNGDSVRGTQLCCLCAGGPWGRKHASSGVGYVLSGDEIQGKEVNGDGSPVTAARPHTFVEKRLRYSFKVHEPIVLSGT